MQNQKIIIVIAVVVVVAIVAACAFVLTSGDGNKDPSDEKDDTPETSLYLTKNSGTVKLSEVDTNLLVFGNANNDNYLDDKDVDYIQKIVNGKSKWDNTANPFADTNADGEITSDDVNLLKRFIAGKKSSMFYCNSEMDTKQITFPLTGKISVTQYNDVDMLKICGKEDMIVACSDMTPDEENYPGSSKWKDIGTYPYDYEKIVAAGVTITLGQSYNYDENFEKLVADGYDTYPIDIVKLFEARWYYHSIGSIACTVTLGALLNSLNDDTYKSYLMYIDNVQEIIDNATQDVPEGGAPSCVLILNYSDSPADMCIRATYSGVINYNDSATLEMLKVPSSYVSDVQSKLKGISIEEILKTEPDFLIMEECDVAPLEDCKADMTNIASWLQKAGFKGKIIGVHYNNFGNAPALCALPLLAKMIYGLDSISDDEAWNYMVDYYNNYLGMHYTLETIKTSMYAPYFISTGE